MQQAPHLVLSTARQALERGRYKEARAAYKQAAKHFRSDPDVYSEFGAVEAELGNIASARKHLKRAASLAPRDPFFRFNLGELERKDKRYTEAEAHYRFVLRDHPGDADARYGLGLCLSATKRHDEAIAELRKAHQLSPRDAEILNELGNTMVSARMCKEAVEVFHAALGIDPAYHEAWFNLGVALAELDSYAPADRAFAKAESIRPVEARLRWKWAQTQVRIAEYEKAMANTEATISEHPEIPHPYFVRGIIHEHFGRFGEAEKDFLKALAIREDIPEVHEKLTQMRKFDAMNETLLERILDDADGYAQSSRASAGFALYHHFRKAAEHDRAFDALRKANAIKHSQDTFDIEEHTRLVDDVIGFFSAEFFDEHRGYGHETDSPIFVFGMPRSGTTLTEQILSAVPGVYAGGEQLVVGDFIKTLEKYPDSLAGQSREWIRDKAQQVLDGLRQHAGDAPYVTDKTPGNYLCLGLLALLFPKAKFVHCVRDLRDVGFSCYEQHFNDGLTFVYSFDGIAHTAHCYRRIMEHWKSVVPIEIYDSVYENLVANPVEEGKKLVEFCGFEWNDAYLDTARVERPVQTASVWQVRQPINTSAVAKWRLYEKQLEPLLSQLEDL